MEQYSQLPNSVNYCTLQWVCQVNFSSFQPSIFFSKFSLFSISLQGCQQVQDTIEWIFTDATCFVSYLWKFSIAALWQ